MQVRHASLKVIQLILGQGLVHPVQVSEVFSMDCISVAEPSHFSSAPAPDIFCFGSGSREIIPAPAPPIKAQLRPAPGL